MIWESQPWKKELNRLAGDISNLRLLVNPDSKVPFKLERAIFYSAFIIRKLIEDGKVTDKFAGLSIDLPAFDAITDGDDKYWATLFGDLQPEEHFDFGNPKIIRMSPKDLASEILHSSAFVMFFDASGVLAGILVCSYQNENKRIFELTFERYVNVLELAAANNVTSVKRIKDLTTGKIRCELK